MRVYKYGMRLRGFSPGAQPRQGWLDAGTDPEGKYWNTLFYNRKLTDEECRDYELDFIGCEEVSE